LIIGTEVGVCSFSAKNLESDRISDAPIREDFLSLLSNDIILFNLYRLSYFWVFVKKIIL